VEQLKDDTEIIFLTKTPMDAIKSYERGFIDCMLKPVTHNRFKSSIDRLINKLECLQLIREKKEHMVHFKCNFKSEKLQANSIRWIEAMGDYVKVVTKNRNYMVLSTMKSFLNKLPDNQFVRIHKSYIVNLKKVINYTTRNVNTDGEILPLSRKQKRIFKENFINFQ
jgi:DNA-binding LytR/AlgR family response regulator